MDLTLTPTEKAFRDELREWLAANKPAPFSGPTHEENPEYVEYLRGWQRQLFEAGWSGVTWPKAFGGREASPIEQAIYLDEMARARAPDIIGFIGIGLIGPTIIALGTEEQKTKYLVPMLSGDKVWCQGFSEPDAGSDLGALKTRAVLDGDHYVVNGQKIWTSIAHVSDFCFLLTRTDPELPKHKGITCLLVDMKSEGVERRPLRMMSGDSGFSEIFFDNVRVPVSEVLGEVNGGWKAAITALMYERVNLGGGLGIALSRYIDSLVQASRKCVKGSGFANEDPLTRQSLAKAYTELEVFRMTSARALSQLVKKGRPGPEGSILKLLWSQTDQLIAKTAMDMFGPYGQLTEGEYAQVSYSYLRSRGRTIEAGTSEILRNTIAERVLGLPKSY